MKRFTFSVPQNILFGEGVLKELPGAAGKLGGKHGFIISGPPTEQTWRSGAV